jgi:ATP-dependent Lon protease
MDQNFVLPVYPDSQDVPLPTLDYKIRVYDSYGKELFDYLQNGEYFILNSTNADFAFLSGDIKSALSYINPAATVCLVKNITKNKASYTVEFSAASAALITSARIMDNSHIVLAVGKLVNDIETDKFMLMPFIDDIRKKYAEISKKIPGFPPFPANEDLDKHEPSFYLAYFLNLPRDMKLGLLRNPDPQARLQFILKSMDGLSADPKIENEINAKVEQALEDNQKEFILREKLKAIKDELKPFDGPTDEDKYNAVINDGKNIYPQYVKDKVKLEMSRLSVMPEGSQEGAVIKTYLDLVCDLPWSKDTVDNENMSEVKKILDEDHYGLTKQKDRILEYLAVKSLTKSLKSPILCLFGPPGTGKTSLAISIAKALNRKFCKISLGGVSDEAEIRGHRKTYVGAMPGRIISNIERVGVNNPVILLDEIDKLTDGGYHGDPAAALLEVLDPEQNAHFQDNYLEIPFDLSNVLFICTANNVQNIPAPLMDRLEMIELNTYTNIEKHHIAFEHLIPLELEVNGLKESNIHFADDAIDYIIENYTMEAGVRELRRKIGAIMRKFAVEFLTAQVKPEEAHLEVTKEIVEKYLGKPLFTHTRNSKSDQVGIVNGLAYTDFGGEILPIEVNFFGGSGQLTLTGNLGKVMEESARTAFSYVKTLSERLHISDDFWKTHDFHIHAPEGAIPKDGPSAGVALAIAILSAATDVPLKNDVAMTGETDLRGNAMPIGGLREKSLAALREHINLICVPKENHKDVEELPDEVKKGLKIIEVESVLEVVPYAFERDPFAASEIKAPEETLKASALKGSSDDQSVKVSVR